MLMRKTVIKYEAKPVTIVTCNFCGNESQQMCTGIKKCKICEQDVCWECSEHIDFECGLLEPYFNSDYPEYVCKSCWIKGEEIRHEIMKARDTAEEVEYKLMEDWECVCKIERDTDQTKDS